MLSETAMSASLLTRVPKGVGIAQVGTDAIEQLTKSTLSASPLLIAALI